jgi:hypothetical protein
MADSAPALPGVAEDGANATVAPGGSPLAARVTGEVKLPSTEAILTW